MQGGFNTARGGGGAAGGGGGAKSKTPLAELIRKHMDAWIKSQGMWLMSSYSPDEQHGMLRCNADTGQPS